MNFFVLPASVLINLKLPWALSPLDNVTEWAVPIAYMSSVGLPSVSSVIVRPTRLLKAPSVSK